MGTKANLQNRAPGKLKAERRELSEKEAPLDRPQWWQVLGPMRDSPPAADLPSLPRVPGTHFWAVSKDKFSTNDLILQNSPRASKRSGKHHFDKLESGRHCWYHKVSEGRGGPSLSSPKRSRCR